MEILMAKLVDPPTSCAYCGGNLANNKCIKCLKKTYDNYENQPYYIKKLIQKNPEQIIKLVVSDKDSKSSKQSDELVGKKLKLGDRYIVNIDKNGFCKVISKNNENVITKYNDFCKILESSKELNIEVKRLEEEQYRINDKGIKEINSIIEKFGLGFIPIETDNTIDVVIPHENSMGGSSYDICYVSKVKEDEIECYDIDDREHTLECAMHNLESRSIIGILDLLEKMTISDILDAASDILIDEKKDTYITIEEFEQILNHKDLKELSEFIFSTDNDFSKDYYNSYSFQKICLTRWPEQAKLLVDNVDINDDIQKEFSDVLEGANMGFFDLKTK